MKNQIIQVHSSD